jgi:hypothetical protein
VPVSGEVAGHQAGEHGEPDDRDQAAGVHHGRDAEPADHPGGQGARPDDGRGDRRPSPVRIGRGDKWWLAEILEWIEADCPLQKVWAQRRQNPTESKGR